MIIHVRQTNEESWEEIEASCIASALKEYRNMHFSDYDEIALEARWENNKTFSEYVVRQDLTLTFVKDGIPEVED